MVRKRSWWKVARLEDLTRSAQELMKLLWPGDFETLADLVFSTSGWRRQGPVGKTQKMLDLDIVLPSTGERAFVQIKAKTTSAELAEYAGKIDELGSYDRMFYVFHSGEVDMDDERVTMIGPETLAALVVNAGLLKKYHRPEQHNERPQKDRRGFQKNSGNLTVNPNPQV
jgi:hypothetical protein